jgi:hypothetical protein
MIMMADRLNGGVIYVEQIRQIRVEPNGAKRKNQVWVPTGNNSKIP